MILTTSVMTVLSMVDQTIANAALPTIAHDVNATAAASVWIVNGYQIGMMVGILPLAQLADILGYWRVYRVSLIAFTLASLACALSHSLLMLSLMRFVQGLGGAAMTVSGPPISRIAFPPKMLGRATGFGAMSVALGAAAGPVIGGAILAVASWQWLFAINVPFGIAVYVLALRTIPKVRGTHLPFDGLDAFLSVATFGLALFGFDALGHAGPTPPAVLAIAAAGGFGFVFLRRQLSIPLPMFAVDLFAEKRFALAAFACYGSFVAQTIAFISLPFAFQTMMGHTPLQIGELLLPWLLAAAALAPLAGHLADRFNSSRLAALGLAVFGTGLVASALMGTHPAPLDIAWRMVLCGLGFGIFQSPNNRSIQGSAPRERSAGAQAIQAVARVTGQTTGAVIVAGVFAGVGTAAGSGITQEAFVLTLAIAAGVAFLSSAASLWRAVLAGSIVLARAS